MKSPSFPKTKKLAKLKLRGLEQNRDHVVAIPKLAQLPSPEWVRDYVKRQGIFIKPPLDLGPKAWAKMRWHVWQKTVAAKYEISVPELMKRLTTGALSKPTIYYVHGKPNVVPLDEHCHLTPKKAEYFDYNSNTHKQRKSSNEIHNL